MASSHGFHEQRQSTFAEVLNQVAKADNLPAQRKREWLCALRRVSAGAGRPPESMPAQWLFVRTAIVSLHPSQLACTQRTLANYKSSVRAALHWFSEETGIPKYGAPLPDSSRLGDRRPAGSRTRR
jgi:hypothetical protein